MSHTALLREYDRSIATDSGRSRFRSGSWGSLLAAHLPVADLAAGSVAALAAAVDRFSMSRGLSVRSWVVDPARITASFSSDKMMRLGGAPVQAFDPLSGFFRSADGWVRTHANYPHHRQALINALGHGAACGPDAFAALLAGIPGAEVERLCHANSAVAVRVRTPREWADAEGKALSGSPLVTWIERGDRTPSGVGGSPSFAAPLKGIRILDLTRVIAGPVATRALALLGATVLRIDSPRLPEIDWQHRDNGQGKRSALVDLDTERGSAIAARLLSEADVAVTGYRPGSVDQLLPALSPGAIRAQVSAWGLGPWYGRRGFDSIVQAATGISYLEGDAGVPGALPAQALDHATGYLLAAAVVDALAPRESGSRGRDVAVSLARTATWLLDASGRVASPPPAMLPSAAETTVTHGSITVARPALERWADYLHPAAEWGSNEPTFDSRSTDNDTGC